MQIFQVIIASALIIFVTILLNSILVYFIWNAVVPEVFGLPIINAWQAFLLSLLSQALIKSDINYSSKDN